MCPVTFSGVVWSSSGARKPGLAIDLVSCLYFSPKAAIAAFLLTTKLPIPNLGFVKALTKPLLN